MNYSEYKFAILSDLYRKTGSIKFITLLKYVLLGGEYKYNFWLRTCQFSSSNSFLKYSIYPISRFILFYFMYKFGIRIDPLMNLGNGLYIGHFGGINVGVHTVIGDNLNISQQVTIGISNRGKNKGTPIIGDNVYIGPGARIFGGIKIGNNVAIGANSVVTKDVPDDSVVVGIPGKVISKKGSKGYINNTNYDELLKF